MNAIIYTENNKNITTLAAYLVHLFGYQLLPASACGKYAISICNDKSSAYIADDTSPVYIDDVRYSMTRDLLSLVTALEKEAADSVVVAALTVDAKKVEIFESGAVQFGCTFISAEDVQRILAYCDAYLSEPLDDSFYISIDDNAHKEHLLSYLLTVLSGRGFNPAISIDRCLKAGAGCENVCLYVNCSNKVCDVPMPSTVRLNKLPVLNANTQIGEILDKIVFPVKGTDDICVGELELTFSDGKLYCEDVILTKEDVERIKMVLPK